jgi:hypothetical protein
MRSYGLTKPLGKLGGDSSVVAMAVALCDGNANPGFHFVRSGPQGGWPSFKIAS